MKIIGIKIPPEIKNLCTPALIYLILSLISIVIYLSSMITINNQIKKIDSKSEGIHQYTICGLIMKIIFIIIWVYLLNYLCKFKFGRKVAWFIVLIPFFFMGLMLIGVTSAFSYILVYSNNNNRSLKNNRSFKDNNRSFEDNRFFEDNK